MFSKKYNLLILFTLLSILLYLGIFYLKEINELYVFFTFNISFLFTDYYSKLQDYYPKYFWFIFILTRSIKYFAPLIIPYLLYRYRLKIAIFLQQFKGEKHTFWLKNLIYFFFSNLIISLFFYVLFFHENFAAQLRISKTFLSMQIMSFALYFLFYYEIIFSKLKSFLLAPILPYSISITRILFFSYLLFLYLNVYIYNSSNFEGLQKIGLPNIEWLIALLPVNSSLYTMMCYLGAVACFFIIIGFKTRFFLLLNTVIVFYVVATPNFFGKLWHEQIIIWISWILALSSSFDIFSFDSLLSKKAIAKKGDYGFHLKIIWLHFGIIYFFAGFYKLWLCGFDWALSNSMINQVHLEWFEHYNKIPIIRIDFFPNLLKIGGLLVILFELFYLFFLFNKKTRWISIIGGLIMHNTIGYFMYISFFYLLQVFYLVFIPWNSLLIKLKIVKQKVVKDSPLSLTKWSVVIPLLILSINILYGIFRIDSYPFSVYPVYAVIVPETIQYFEYHILDKDYSELKVHELGKEQYFNWESYSRIESEIITKFENTNKLDSSGILQQWQRWQNGVPELNKLDSVEIWSVEVYLNPNKMNDTIKKEYLITLFL